MKKKKYIPVVIAVALIWGLVALSEKINSSGFDIFMYISFVFIVLLLLVWQIILRISLLYILTQKREPVRFIQSYRELDGNKYTPTRHIYEALALVLLGNFKDAEINLNNAGAKNVDILKADAVLMLCYYFSGNINALKYTLQKLMSDCNSVNRSKSQPYVHFASLINAVISEEQSVETEAEKYFVRMEKNDFIEFDIVNYFLAELNIKNGNVEKAAELLMCVHKNCPDTVLSAKAEMHLNKLGELL